MGEVAVRTVRHRWVRTVLAGVAVAGLLGGWIAAGTGSASNRPALAENGAIIVEN